MADTEFEFASTRYSDVEAAPTKRTAKTTTTTTTEKTLNVSVNQPQTSDSEQGSQLSTAGPGVHLAPDGSAILDPLPSASPRDPLNWSWAKKHAVLFSLIPGCLLSDWALTWGSTVFELQAHDWNMTVQAVSNSLSPGIFMQGPGGILAVPLCQRYGRLPVLFWSQLLSLAVTIGATLAPTYAGFTACRALQGFFGAAPQVIGLSVIHDMFFFHERARKINIWAASFLIGPYFGPLISSLTLLSLDWRPDFSILAGFYASSVLTVLCLGDETLFDRDSDSDSNGTTPTPTPTEPRNSGSSSNHSTTTLPYRLLQHLALLTGITGFKAATPHHRPRITTVLKHQTQLLTRPHLLLPTALFITPLTMWTIGLVSTLPLFVLPPPPPTGHGYGFSYRALALLYLAPIIGTLLAEAYGHYANDFLFRRHNHNPNPNPNHSNNPTTTTKPYKPESRLPATYPPLLLGIAGLLLFGQSLQHHLPWPTLALAWASVTFATLGATTPISAYVLDTHPLHAAPAAAWLNAWRVVGGFCVVYFLLVWVGRAGPGLAFGLQAFVIGVAGLSVLVTQVYGEAWRRRCGDLSAEN